MTTSGFRLWPDSALRTSGFPIEDVKAFGCPELAADDADRTSYERAAEANRVALERVVTADRFRQALLWQNPLMVTDSAEAWLGHRRSDKPPSRGILRQENLLVKYAQRYHTKNESVGFFGPVGWVGWPAGLLAPGSGAATVTGTAGELDTCRIQVEHRVVARLARAFAEERELRRTIRPFRVPGVLIDGREARSSGLGTFVLPEPKHQVLAACDGSRTVAEIEDIIRSTPSGRGVDVQGILTGLVRAGLVSQDLRVPPTPFPETWLRRFLASTPADTTGAEAILDELDRAKLAAATANDEVGVRAALERSRSVVRGVLDGSAASLGERRDWRDVLVHERTCSMRLALGPDPLAALLPPLECLLVASRWLTWQVSEHFSTRLAEILDRDADEKGRLPGLVAAQLLAGYQGEPFRAEIAEILAEFRRRWSLVVPGPLDRSRVRHDLAEVRERIAAQFAAPLVDWLSGRYHSPDVMLAAADAEAIATGDYEWVLGELHSAQNTIEQWIFVTAHPRPDRLAELLERDTAGRRWVLPLYPSDTPEVSSRSHPPPHHVSPRFDYLRFVAGEAPRDGVAPEQVIDIADVWLTRSDDGEVVVDHADGRRWGPMEMFGELLGDGLGGSFQPYPPAPHRPRVSIGSLTVAREQWRDEEDEFERHRTVTSWVQDAGLPRFVFVRCTGEPKPFYVDLTSPLLVTMLVRSLQRQAERFPATEVVVTEMYPTPDRLWAPYDEARRCTSEIRIAFFDTGAVDDRRTESASAVKLP
jgi:hypothetical protein